MFVRMSDSSPSLPREICSSIPLSWIVQVAALARQGKLESESSLLMHLFGINQVTHHFRAYRLGTQR